LEISTDKSFIAQFYTLIHLAYVFTREHDRMGYLPGA